MKSQHHKSVYISTQLKKALQEHPKVNVGQVCKVALEAATGLIPTAESSSPAELMSTKLLEAESRLRSNISTFEKIARLAATNANMVVMTPEEAEAYQEIVSGGIKKFVARTQKEAIQEYKSARARRRHRKNKAQGLAEPSAPPPEHESKPDSAPLCADCGDLADVTCKTCGAPLCWICWTGPDIDAPARETCQKCSDPPPA